MDQIGMHSNMVVLILIHSNLMVWSLNYRQVTQTKITCYQFDRLSWKVSFVPLILEAKEFKELKGK